jgi:hypothetical protein
VIEEAGDKCNQTLKKQLKRFTFDTESKTLCNEYSYHSEDCESPKWIIYVWIAVGFLFVIPIIVIAIYFVIKFTTKKK